MLLNFFCLFLPFLTLIGLSCHLDMRDFVLFYCILFGVFGCCLLKTCSFLKRNGKGMD